MPAQPPTLLDKVRETLRLKHYSPGTKETYIYWIKQFILQRGGMAVRSPLDEFYRENNPFVPNVSRISLKPNIVFSVDAPVRFVLQFPA
jgi:hypothetical protein